VALVLFSYCIAGETNISLIPGPGREKVVANCMMCHSLDYIENQAGFLDKKQWASIVNKMKISYGAPVSEKDIPIIVAYLSKNYGIKPTSGKHVSK
jgi:hypothetical protein